jgi:glycerol-3-phosphate dehydrogenase subunit B
MRPGFLGDCDVAVIGAGLAGSAAAVFAVDRGLSTLVCGDSGQSCFASGLFDLLGAHPADSDRFLADPWEGLEALRRHCPDHPYARLRREQIQSAVAAWLAHLADCGLAYRHQPQRNLLVLTAAGTLKPTYAVPPTVWPGIQALAEGRRALIAGFHGLREFSAHQIAAVAARLWPSLRPVCLDFPDGRPGAERAPELMAMAVVREEVRRRLAEALRQAAADAEVVGLPAVLGRQADERWWRDLQARVGRPIFEIPTLPPSLPGLRLREALTDRMRRSGMDLAVPGRVQRVEIQQRHFHLELVEGHQSRRVLARSLIVATGRFLGGGLTADRQTIREPLLDLPVVQPPHRRDWHRPRFFDPAGHPINRCGLVVDDAFRPLDARGRAVHPRLAAAGTILAGHDWAREKCGSGLAVASAWAAVNTLARELDGKAPRPLA